MYICKELQIFFKALELIAWLSHSNLAENGIFWVASTWTLLTRYCRAAFRAAFGATFRVAFEAPRADARRAIIDFGGLVPFLGAILRPDLGCSRSLSIVVAEIDCPIDELFAAAKAFVSTALNAGGRFKRRLALVAFSGTTTPKKVNIKRLHTDLQPHLLFKQSSRQKKKVVSESVEFSVAVCEKRVSCVEKQAPKIVCNYKYTK